MITLTFWTTGVLEPVRVRVKICGITRPEDGVAAARLGVDAVGLVFYPASPRAVTIAQGRAIVKQLPPFVTVVGLFVNASEQMIREVLDGVPLDLLQFHGDEPPECCGIYGRPYVKALAMREDMDVQRESVRYADAAGLLLDAWHRELRGGSGERFDWTRIPRDLDKPLILAGGLTPENVQAAMAQVQPYALDVSSGVESSKGVKDPRRMARFMRNVTAFHCEHGS